jgi:hypothetical protein
MNKTFPIGLGIVLSAIACTPLKNDTTAAVPDLTPPVLTRTIVDGPRTVRLTFDDVPVVEAGTCVVEPALAVAGITAEGNQAIFTFAADLEIGKEYRLRLAVDDTSGNGVWLIVRFYGFNPSPPRLLINEFTTQGSATHPDLVEIKVMSGGNMGGLCFYHGASVNSVCRFVFPAFRVEAGDFILLHVKPQGIPAEIDEPLAPDASGGLDACPTARDFWVRDGSGLAGNNGTLSIYDRPNGQVLDAVLYSTRTSDADTAYRGFGSYDLVEQADEIAAAGAWRPAGEKIAPEDAVNPDASTATRSICRSASSADMNEKADWHVVPTKQASFGRDNSNEAYEP